MKISCLTVTQISRIELLEKSIHSFASQTIESKFRELVIVHHDGEYASTMIRSISEKYSVDAKIFSVPKLPLGELRNLSLGFATGDIICQWDDDDICHSSRLVEQSKPFNSDDCIATSLSSQIYLFYDNNELYIRKGASEGIHGTFMFRNGLGFHYQSNLTKGEDSQLISEILKYNSAGVFCIDNRPELFVRTYHGQNTWEYTHHYDRLKKQAYNQQWLLENKETIIEWLRQLDITGVFVRDTNDIAFIV